MPAPRTLFYFSRALMCLPSDNNRVVTTENMRQEEEEEEKQV